MLKRDQIEGLSASIAVFLLIFMTIAGILAIANGIFDWDILPPSMERILWFIFASLMVIIVSAVLVNVMINISIIAVEVKKFVTSHSHKYDK